MFQFIHEINNESEVSECWSGHEVGDLSQEDNILWNLYISECALKIPLL